MNTIPCSLGNMTRTLNAEEPFAPSLRAKPKPSEKSAKSMSALQQLRKSVLKDRLNLLVWFEVLDEVQPIPSPKEIEKYCMQLVTQEDMVDGEPVDPDVERAKLLAQVATLKMEKERLELKIKVINNVWSNEADLLKSENNPGRPVRTIDDECLKEALRDFCKANNDFPSLGVLYREARKRGCSYARDTVKGKLHKYKKHNIVYWKSDESIFINTLDGESL